MVLGMRNHEGHAKGHIGHFVRIPSSPIGSFVGQVSSIEDGLATLNPYSRPNEMFLQFDKEESPVRVPAETLDGAMRISEAEFNYAVRSDPVRDLRGCPVHIIFPLANTDATQFGILQEAYRSEIVLAESVIRARSGVYVLPGPIVLPRQPSMLVLQLGEPNYEYLKQPPPQKNDNGAGKKETPKE